MLNRDCPLRRLLPLVALLATACATTMPVSPVTPAAPTATPPVLEGADAARGARRFVELPCAGCHGATAQGQFGPPLAGTELTLADVRRQVRQPRDQMPAFPADVVAEQDIADIHAWLQTLSPVTPTPPSTLPPPEATAAALDRLFPLFTAADIAARRDALDEVAFRAKATVVSLRDEGRYVRLELAVTDETTHVAVDALYDTAMSRQAFPGAVGDRLLLYGVGAHPATPGGNPRLQIVYVRPAPP